ncbi:MAG: hypothetical protein RIT24_2900 [Planctomycetota bacterium]
MHRAPLTASLTVLALATSNAIAQTTAAPATTIATADPIRIELQGPAQWRTQFGPTNLGSLLASEAGSSMWKGYVTPLEGMLKGALGLDDAAYAEARARMLDYGGSIAITFDFDGDDEGLRVAFGPDGSTDLPKLCDDLAKLAARMSDAQWTERDGALPMLQIGPEHFVSKPEIRGSDATDWTATFAISRDTGLPAAQTAAAALGVELHARRGEKAARSPFSLLCDVPAAIAANGGMEDAATSAMLGLESMREIGLSIRAAGPQAQVEASMRFDGKDRGLFEILFPDTQGLPAISALRPADAALWKTGRCDFRAIRRVIRAFADRVDATADNVDEEMPPAIFDEQEGLLAHFTDEYAFASSAQSVEDLEDSQSNLVFAVRIRDHAKFADKWNAARKDLGFTELSSEEQDGFVVQRLGGLVAVTAAYGPELLVIGYGRDVRDQVDAWITKAQDGAWTTSKPAMPQGLSRAAPDGCNGTAEGQVAMVLGQIVGSMGFVQSITGDMGQGFDWQQVDVEAVQQLLKEHNLDIARSLTGYRDGWWRMRVFW